MMTALSPEAIQRVLRSLEHTYLNIKEGESPEVTIPKICAEALQYNMATVCVRPEHVSLARHALGASETTLLAAVVGFPERALSLKDEAEYPVVGACNSTTKLQEITAVQMYGGEELDVVMNVRYLQTDVEVNGTFTQNEFEGLRLAAGDVPIKLILEVDLLSDAELRFAIECAVKAKLDMIKTSTGFVKGCQGATPERIRQMRRILDELGAPHVGIKASGGIRTLEDALALLDAGANRLGTSNAVAIARQALGEEAPAVEVASSY